MIESGDEAVVTYEGTRVDAAVSQHEVLTFDGERIARTEVDYGGDLELSAACSIVEGCWMSTTGQLISGVDFIAIPTRDYESARKFYGEVLRAAVLQAVGGHARR